MRKIAIIKIVDDFTYKVMFEGPYNKSLYKLLYPIFKNCYIWIFEDEEIKVILTYDEFLNSEV